MENFCEIQAFSLMTYQKLVFSKRRKNKSENLLKWLYKTNHLLCYKLLLFSFVLIFFFICFCQLLSLCSQVTWCLFFSVIFFLFFSSLLNGRVCTWLYICYGFLFFILTGHGWFFFFFAFNLFFNWAWFLF